MPITLLKRVPPDQDGLRETNRRGALSGRGFEHPSYPPPFDDFPRCCYEGYEDLYGHLPRSQYGLCKASPDPDPFSVTNLGLAQAAVDRYRSQVSYPAWSNRIAEYPAPDWLNKKSRQVTGGNYASAEKDAGHRIEWWFDEVIPLLELRAFVLGCLTPGDDPQVVLKQVLGRHKRDPIQNITGWLLGIAKRNGVSWPQEPRGDAPVTTIYRPSLADAIPEWGPGPPGFDASFQEETDATRAGNPSFLEALAVTEVGMPDTSPADWIAGVRSTLDPARAKAKDAKLSRWRK